jgi:hypothetical protein
MRKILIGLVAAIVLVAVVLFLRSAGHKAATTTLARAVANLPPGITATHGTATYDPILGTFSVADLTVSRNGAPMFTAARVQASGIARQGQDTTPRSIGHLTIEDVTFPPGRHAARIELTGVAVADLRDVLDPANYPDGKPAWSGRRVLIEHGDITEFSSEVPAHDGLPATVGRFKHAHIDQLAGRPFALPPTQENVHNPLFWADVVLALAEKSATVDKIDLSVGGTFHYTIGADSMQGLDGGRLDSLRVSDLRVERSVAGGEFKLADASVEAIDITRVLPLLPQISDDPKNAAKMVLGGVRAGKIRMDGGDLLVAKAPHVQFASLDGSQDRHPDGKGTAALTVKSLSLAFDPATLPPSQAQSFQRFGMTDFIFDLFETADFDLTSQHFVLNHFDLTARGLGSLHMMFSSTGGIRDDAPKTPQEALQRLHDLLLEHATIRWDDESLTNRAITLAAESKGTTPDALRAQLGMATMALTMVMPNQPDAATQVNNFLAHPKTLTITLAPPKPISFFDVTAAPVAQRAGLLGAHIEAE